MLTKLKLKNFQGHRSLDIELGRTVTSIIGPTDSGKSAILRALRWLCLNKPSSKLINDAAKQATVKLTVDKKVVTRRKGKSNIYKLDGKTFKAFGTKVPDEIAQHLNVSEVSFQGPLGQHDAPFWFSLTPGQVSKELNSIVNLGVIDNSLSNIASKLRKARTVVEVSEERYNLAYHELLKLKWVPKAHKLLTRIETLESTLDAKRRKRENLEGLLQQALDLETDIEHAETRLLAGQELIAGAERLIQVRLDRQRLEDLIRSQEQLAAIDHIVLPNIKPLVRVRRERELLEDLITQYQDQETEICRLHQQGKDYEKQISKVKRCPLCGKKIKVE